MSLTLKLMRDQVILDAEIQGNPKFTDLRIDNMINQSQRYVQIQLTGLGMKKWEAKSSEITGGSLSAGTYAGNNVKEITIATALPNCLESARSISQIEIEDGTNYGEAKAVDKDNLYTVLSNSLNAPTIKRGIFCRLSGKIIIAPSTVTSAFIHYYKTVSDLSADTDKTEIPLEYAHFIVKKTVLDIDHINGKINDKVAAENEIKSDIANVYKSFQIMDVNDNAIANAQNARMQ